MSERIKDGGSAFPKALDPYPNVQDIVRADRVPESGMSLRDYFAAKALTGLLAHASGEDPDVAPARAYKLADAMLKAREVKS